MCGRILQGARGLGGHVTDPLHRQARSRFLIRIPPTNSKGPHKDEQARLPADGARAPSPCWLLLALLSWGGGDGPR